MCTHVSVCVLEWGWGACRSSRTRVRAGDEGREVSEAQMKAHYNDISFRQL